MNRTLLLALVASAAAALPASAQIASGLIREGDTPSGVPAGQVITFIGEPAVNHATGYAVGLTTSDGANSINHLWGATDLGAAPALFRSEQTIGNLQQNSFESFWGYSDAGNAGYSPICTDIVSGATGLDCVFLDDTVLAEEDQPIVSLPGKVWRFASRPGVSGDGIPFWVGGIDDGTTGADEGRGLFLDTTATVVLKSGDVLPNTGGPIGPSGISFDYRFSRFTTHYIVEIDTDETTSVDNYMIVDGQVLTAGGPTDFVREGSPIPASVGGLSGENWDNFDYLGITENLEYMFTGDTDGATTSDEIIVKNGQILYREGQTLDGEVLIGSIDNAYMNEFGNIAFIWDVVDPLGTDLEALYLNDRLLLKEGDAVDLDGDGVIEPTSLLVNMTDVVIGYDSAVYFAGTVDVNGTSTTSDDIEALFRMECLAVPYGVGKLNSLGQRSELSSAGEPSLAAANFSLEVSGLTTNNFGLAIWGPAPTEMPLFNHFGYVASPTLRILPVVVSSATGTASVPIPIDASMVGTSRFYQYWQRDPQSPDGTGVELSNGLAVRFCN